MPRQRSPNRDKAYTLWKESGGELTNKAIAEKLGENEKLVATWKSRDKWSLNPNDVHQSIHQTNAVHQLDKKIIASVENNDALTDKQRAFCLHYAKTFNAYTSAIKAGYSPDSAYIIGWENLRKPSIKDEIKRLKEIRNLSMLANADDVVEMHMRIAFADIGDFIAFDSVSVPIMVEGLPLIVDGEPVTTQKNIVSFKPSAETDTQLLSEIKESRDGVSVKLTDRHKSLDFLAKYFELNPMDRHKKAYDEAKLEIEREKLEQQKMDTNNENGVLNEIAEYLNNGSSYN